MENTKAKKLDIIGWREWVSLPSLNVKQIKAKIDSGAATSALHVTNLSIESIGKKHFVRFKVHPNQKSSKPSISCRAQLVEHRNIKSSTGGVTLRPVIMLPMKIGEHRWLSEVTLVNRDMMGFRMLIGRKALRNRFLVHAGRSFLIGKKKKINRIKGLG